MYIMEYGPYFRNYSMMEFDLFIILNEVEHVRKYIAQSGLILLKWSK